jgi:hypothetical protein
MTSLRTSFDVLFVEWMGVVAQMNPPDGMQGNDHQQ